jgi:hypothetical protein
MSQVVECLPSKSESPNSFSNTTKETKPTQCNTFLGSFICYNKIPKTKLFINILITILEAGKAKIKALARFSVWFFFASLFHGCAFCVLTWISFIRTLVTFTRVEISWLNHFLDALSINTITLGYWFQHEFEGEGDNIQSTVMLFSHVEPSFNISVLLLQTLVISSL